MSSKIQITYNKNLCEWAFHKLQMYLAYLFLATHLCSFISTKKIFITRY